MLNKTNTCIIIRIIKVRNANTRNTHDSLKEICMDRRPMILYPLHYLVCKHINFIYPTPYFRDRHTFISVATTTQHRPLVIQFHGLLNTDLNVTQEQRICRTISDIYVVQTLH